MKTWLTHQDIANTVRMTRSLHSGTIVLVEGDSDMRFYANFVDDAFCRLINATCKENAIKAVEVLENEHFQGIAAIVDADFMFVGEIPTKNENLCTTDTHDLETMLLKSPAFEKVLTEFGSARKVAEAQRALNRDVRSTILNVGLPVGYLRWISFKKGLSLDFEALSFRKFVDKECLAVDASRLIKAVKDKTRNCILSQEELMEQLIQASERMDDPWQVCCGHDLVCILSIGFCKLLGSHNSGEVSPEILERSLRLAYETSHFVETSLYRALREWETHNPPFRIFRL